MAHGIPTDSSNDKQNTGYLGATEMKKKFLARLSWVFQYYHGRFQLQAWKQWLIKHVKKCENVKKHFENALGKNVKNAFQTHVKKCENVEKCWKTGNYMFLIIFLILN